MNNKRIATNYLFEATPRQAQTDTAVVPNLDLTVYLYYRGLYFQEVVSRV